MFPLHDNIPTRRFPFVNYLLIAANIAVFFHEAKLAGLGALEPFLQAHALIPAHLIADPWNQWPTIFTAMFLHGGWGHVLGNMWFLHIFGDNVEDNVGHVKYFFYYLLMGLGAAAAQVWVGPASMLPMVGASGAIAGILGSYFVLNPGAKISTFFFIFIFVRIIEIPAYFFLGVWFLIQALNSVGMLTQTAMRGEMGGVAWMAHAGGFVSGFLAIWFFRRRRRYVS